MRQTDGMSSLISYMRWLVSLKIEELGMKTNIIFTSAFRRFDHNTASLSKCIPFPRRNKSNRPEVFCKKRVLRNFAKFTGKQLFQSFFFNKVAGLTPATLLKKRLWRRCFPVNFVKFLRTPFLTEHLRWLLLTKI